MMAFEGYGSSQMMTYGEMAPRTTRPGYVLIVDDDPAIVELLVTLLHDDEGFEVHAAQSVAQALKEAPSASPALIILDMTLPGTAVRDAAAHLRGRPGWKDAPLALCSGQERIASAADELGAIAYLRKPFNIEAVVTLAERYMQPRLP
jgi:CheY-like chemotaxis protein